MPETNTLSANKLSCVRGERELFHDLDMQVSSGQCLHIIGPNGCGKTSLLRILSGLNRPESGDVYWNNTRLSDSSTFLANSAFIGHKDALKNELTAVENLRFYQLLDKPINESVLDDCLNRLKILHCADLLAQQLSFGQRRRLAFAKLLLKQFKVWILDEPFTGIDADGRAIIENLCKAHLDAGGAIALTHHQSLQSSSLNSYLNELTLSS